MKRPLAFAFLLFITACTLYAAAQPRRPAPKPAAAADAAAREERDAGAPKGGAIVEAKGGGDGGAKVFRFGEVEVEGRLKSPQIVYFLRRVRAEFAAGDLGHRSFVRELDETKNEPSF
jgi:hypothetical protein